MRRVTLTRQAGLDLQEIWTYIAEDNLDAADRLNLRLTGRMQQLAEYPGAGHSRPDVRDPEVRFATVYPYLIAYKYDDQAVTVLRVLSGYRDFGKLIDKSDDKNT